MAGRFIPRPPRHMATQRLMITPPSRGQVAGQRGFVAGGEQVDKECVVAYGVYNPSLGRGVGATADFCITCGRELGRRGTEVIQKSVGVSLISTPRAELCPD